MKTKKMLVVSLMGLVALASCGGGGSSQTSILPGSETSTGPSTSEDVPEPAVKANGVRNFAAAPGSDRAEILKQLETYTLDNFLGGVPYRDNSAVVLYHPRLEIPADDYVVGYGFGVGEALINAPLSGAGINPSRRMYYHSWNSTEPGTINYLDGQDSVTGDLHAMVSSSYWGNRFNEDKTGYEWYPVLAQTDQDRPIPLNLDPATGMATKWRVKVQTGGDLRYDTLSAKPEVLPFWGQEVLLDDYLTPFKLMIEEGWFRSTDLGSRASGFVGVAEELAKDEPSIDNVAGIKLNEAEQSIDFEFNTAKTAFYAMYNLSSSLFSPIPLAFIDAIGGAENYGKPNIDSILSLGVYTLENWELNKEVVFKKNPLWIEADRYTHQGYVFTVLEDQTVAFNEFIAGKLDSVGVPSAQLQAYKNDERARQTKGDTVWKLQTNAADQELWNELFGPQGTVSPGSEWDLKPVMSNHDFLNGVYFSLDRGELAEATGSRPAQAFLSEAYMVDPEAGISWRSSDEGKEVVSKRLPGSAGYSEQVAAEYFNTAMDDLIAAGKYTRGTTAAPTVITLEAIFQSQTQVTGEGAVLKRMIEEAFNDNVDGFKLVIHNYATEDWMDAYYAAMFGEFDFAFGSISGNTLDPISFMDTVSSDNRSGFTLSWGTDTSAADGQIVFQNEIYSFDALLESAQGPTILNEGQVVPAFTFDGLSFRKNEADPTKFDISASGTYFEDPNAEFVVAADPDGLSEESGAFLGIFFFEEAEPYAFVDGLELDVTTWADGEWTVEAEAVEINLEGAYWMDVYVSFSTTYGGEQTFSAQVFGLVWEDFAPAA